MPMNNRLLRPTASGAAFTPATLSGLIGWYDSLDLTAMAQNSDGTGAVAVGDPVGYWADKSGGGNHVTQATAANRPTLTAAAVNGRAALVFDGSNDNLSRASYTAQNSLSGLTRIAVYSTGQASMMGRVFSGGGDVPFQTVSSTLRSTVTDGNGVSVPAVGSLPLRIYASVFDGSLPQMNILFDNVAQAATTIGTLPATTGAGNPTLHIGSNVGANNFNDGPIAEYIIYSRALSSGELTAVYQHLRKKWAF